MDTLSFIVVSSTGVKTVRTSDLTAAGKFIGVAVRGSAIFGQACRNGCSTYVCRSDDFSRLKYSAHPEPLNPTMKSYSLQMPERLVFLRVTCAFAEGTAKLVADVQQTPGAAASACVSTVLNDPHGRIAVLGGREGVPRSLGSLYGGSVTRFLGGSRGGAARATRDSPNSFFMEDQKFKPAF